MHTLERQREQLAYAGIANVPAPDISWMDKVPSSFPLPDTFGLLVPGGAPHRPEKRWVVERYAYLARNWTNHGITPVLIGSDSEQDIARQIMQACPEALNLTGKTSISDIAYLARRAHVAVGNDTGPMHLAAVAGCRCIVLYSAASDPALCAQRGRDVTILREEKLSDISVMQVFQISLDST
jgi:ADP-heptose:LPS heptosyltransferase